MNHFYFIASRGRLQRYAEAKILRTDRLDGTGLTVDSVSIEPTPAIVDACDKLARRLDYTGLACAQFLVGDQGELKCFLEINPRLGAAFVLPHACGVNFPKLAVEQLLGHSPANGQPDDYRRGVRFGWLYGDLQSISHAFRSGKASLFEIPRLLYTLVRTFLDWRVHPTWSLSDPLPTFVNYVRLVKLGMNKVWKIIRGSDGA